MRMEIDKDFTVALCIVAIKHKQKNKYSSTEERLILLVLMSTLFAHMLIFVYHNITVKACRILSLIISQLCNIGKCKKKAIYYCFSREGEREQMDNKYIYVFMELAGKDNHNFQDNGCLLERKEKMELEIIYMNINCNYNILFSQK